jgi:endonuclease YncB( thermonuclease family)
MTFTTRLLGGLTTTLLAASLMVTPAAAGQAPGVMLPAGNTTTARVTKIVDGDTIRTTKGTIRLVGIDTPERGRCNAAKATAKTRKLVPVGSRVTLTRPKGNNNTDRYGRYLRYVSRNGIDVGGALIKAGLADARYDSRDGYPRHPKQARYRSWDARYPDKRCTGTSTGTGASDTYTGCRAYGPGGTSVDDQGRRYTKIDCTTKKPL